MDKGLSYPIILGLSWFRATSPTINWNDLSFSFSDDVYDIPSTLSSIESSAELTVSIPDKYLEFAKVFSKELSKQIPPDQPFNCSIEIKDGAKLPSYFPIYPLSKLENEAMDKFISEGLELLLISRLIYSQEHSRSTF